MNRVTLVKPAKLESLLNRLGFRKVRSKGGHALWRHEDGRFTVVPLHHGRELARPLLQGILKEINLSPNRYQALLKGL